jgi:hypothetical protein
MDDLQKIEILQRRVTEHLANMKRLERDNQNNHFEGEAGEALQRASTREQSPKGSISSEQSPFV